MRGTGGLRQFGALVVALVLAATAVEGAAAGPRTHLVQPGETLFRIARRYSVSVEALARANGLSDPARIYAGQRLHIPEPQGSGKPAAAPRAPQPAPPAPLRPAPGRPASSPAISFAGRPTSPPAGFLYVVQRGDTLYSIARRHGTTVAALMRANGLTSELIEAGQQLAIPAVAPRAGAPAPSAASGLPGSADPVGRELVTVRPLRVRRGPKRYHTTLAIVAVDTPLRVLREAQGWYEVELPTGETGWIPADDLSPELPPAPPDPVPPRGADLVREALRYVGTPYRWGGESSRGVDCSGFVYVVFAARVPNLARLRSFDYFRLGSPVERAALQPGDLVFFTTYAPGPSHVGIYAGDGRFVHASSGAGRVVVTPLDDPYYAARYLGARRLLAR